MKTQPQSFKPLLAGLVFTLSTMAASPAFAADPGTKAPDFDLVSNEGKLKLSDLKGQYVYLDFWASWCGPCRASFPWMNSLQEKYAGKGFKVVGINVDKKLDEAKQFLKEVPAKFSIAYDDTGATPKAYGVKGMPTSLLIGPDGNVLFVHQSFKDSDKTDIENKIRLAMEKK
jgi:cytochrome c biogenesis protein CcmG, thiol:disulfide interchange protein DsbE